MQKNFTQLIAHFLNAKRYTVPAGALLLFLATSLYVWAAVGVTVSGGASFPVSADLAANATLTTPAYTEVGTISIIEEFSGDISKSGSIILRAPSGWRFRTSPVPGASAKTAPGESGSISISVGTPTVATDGSRITIPLSVSNTNKREQIDITGVYVQALNGGNIPGSGNISIDVADGAAVTGLPSTLSKALSQVAGAARKLAFTTQPGGALINASLDPQPVVAIQDQFGNTVTTATASVNVAIGNNLSGGTLNGTKTVNVVNGIASFSGLSIDKAGTGYTLVASSSGLTSVTSTPFTVNNPRPVITDVVECVTVGDPQTTVTVTGSNFVSGATVTFDGVTRAASFVNSTTLTTVLTTADLSSVRDVNVTVNNPLPASNNGVSLPISERVRGLFSFPIEGEPTICANTVNSPKFTAQTGGNVSSYNWTVVSGDASIVSGGTTGNPRITFGEPGKVVLSVVYNNFCGKPGAPATLEVTVNPRPDVELTASKTDICASESVKLSVSGAESYVWSGTGVPTGTTGSSLDVTPTVTTTYTVVGSNSYTVNGITTSCPTTKTITIDVTPALSQGSITGTTQLCQNAAATALTATVSGGGTATRSFIWEESATGEEGTWSQVATTATYTPSTATAGVMYYRRTVSAGACTVTSDPIAVTVTPAIVDNTIATQNQNICSGDGIALLDGAAATAGSQEVAYFWEQSATGTGNWTAAVGENGNTGEDFQPDTRTVINSNTIYYRRTSSAGNCTNNSDVVTVTVNPRPEATVTQGQFTYFCSPGTALLSAKEVAGASYKWFRVVSGGDDVEVAATRTTNVGVVGTYYVVVNYDATTCESTSATISVQETVVGNNIIGTKNGDQEVCYNTIPLEIVGSEAESRVGPITYQWEVSSDNVTFTNLSGAIGINLSRAQLGAHTADRWYRRKAIVGSCTNLSTQTVHISVKPELLLSSPTTADVICSGTAFTYNPTSNAPANSIYSWSRADVAGISNAAATGEGSISEELINTTSMPLEVTYIYRITTLDNCESALQYVTVKVNPRPVLNNTTTAVAVCSNTPFTYTATTATTSLPAPTFAWTRAAVAGIDNAAASGSTATINETLVNTTTAPINVMYVYTISANGCAGEPQNVVVTVNPRPVLSSTLTPPAICSGAAFTYTPTSATEGASFSWERLAAINITSNGGTTGTGAVRQTLTNSGTAPVEVTFRFTTSANGCAGTSTEDVKVTVNPSPALNSALTASVCSGNTFNYTPTSLTADASFSWARTASGGNAAASGSGAISEILTNSTTAPITVTYEYITTANNCPGTPQNLVVTIDPRPVLSSTLTPAAICSNTTFSYTPTSATTGASFSWTRAAVTGISNAAVTTPVAGGVSETLVNTTTAPIKVTYVYTISANGCAGEPQNVVVTVNPRPVLSSTLTPPAICSGATFSYTPTSATEGASFSWERLAATNITSNGGTTGTGAVNQTLTNSGTVPVDVTYRYTTSANGCAGTSTEDVKVTVNPTPRLTSTQTPAAICGSAAFNYTATSATLNTAFSWSRAAVPGISNPAATNVESNIINETLINTTTSAIDVVYVFTLTANNCTNRQNVTVRVNPNQPVAFTGAIADNSVFYTGQGSVALAATPTGGAFSGPGVSGSTFNPCAAGPGTHTITYRRTTGSCASTVSKTVTVIQSTYTAVITANPHPFCKGGGGTTYTAAVYRDVQPGEIIYPYLVNADGQPVDRAGTPIPKGNDSFPVANPAYPFPANTPESVKALAYRFFQPEVSPALASRQIDQSLFTYQWAKNDEQNRKNDLYQTKDAGLSSQDYYGVQVISKSGALCSGVDLLSNRMYTAALDDYNVSVTATPNPICPGQAVTFLAKLGLDGVTKVFPWDVANVQVAFVLTRGNVTLTTIPYSGSVTNGSRIVSYTTDYASAGGFINGDQVSVRLTSDVDRFFPGNNCTGATTSNTITIVVNQPVAVAPQNQIRTICVGGSASFSANATGTALSYQWYKDGNLISGATSSTLAISNAQTANAGQYSVKVENTCTPGGVTVVIGSLTVNPKPTATLTPNDATTKCVGAGNATTFSLTGTTTGGTEAWSIVNRTGGATAVFTTITNPRTVTVTGTGSVTVRLTSTNSNSGCTTATQDVVLTVNPLPVVQTITTPDGTSYCSGSGAGVQVGLAGSQVGVVYTLTNSSGNVATVNGTGAAVTFPGNITAGTYTVAANNTATTCSSTMTGNVTITERPVLTAYQVSGGGSYCTTVTESFPIRLSGSEAGVDYTLWRTTADGVTSWVQTLDAGDFTAGNPLEFSAQSIPGTYTVKAGYDTGPLCTVDMTGSATVQANDPAPTLGDLVVTWADDAMTKWIVVASQYSESYGANPNFRWYTRTAASPENPWIYTGASTTNTLNIDAASNLEIMAEVLTTDGTCRVFVLTNIGVEPLPVEIIYLTASKQGNNVLLEWATAMEKDNKGFEVQVSKDGLNYRLLTFVPSKNGNTNTKQVYAFTDQENGKDGTRYYRLKQIDNAGTFEFFGPKMVTFGSVASKVIAFPNPFHDEITLDIASETDGEMLIVVNDAVGKQLMQRKVRVEKGFTTEKLKLGAGLPRGLYIIKTQIGGYTQFIKMIKE